MQPYAELFQSKHIEMNGFRRTSPLLLLLFSFVVRLSRLELQEDYSVCKGTMILAPLFSAPFLINPNASVFPRLQCSSSGLSAAFLPVCLGQKATQLWHRVHVEQRDSLNSSRCSLRAGTLYFGMTEKITCDTSTWLRVSTLLRHMLYFVAGRLEGTVSCV